MKYILILLIVLTSCSTRKVDVVNKEVETTIIKDSIVAETKVIEIKNDIDIFENVIEAKTIVVKDNLGNEITFTEAKIKKIKKIDKTILLAIENKEIVKKTIEKKIESTKNKKSERKDSWWNLLWIIVPLGIAYYLLKK